MMKKKMLLSGGGRNAVICNEERMEAVALKIFCSRVSLFSSRSSLFVDPSSLSLVTVPPPPSLLMLVLLRIQGLGLKDPTIWPFFAGERKSGSSRQGFESLLPGKKHPKLLESLPIWATFGTKIFFAVFSAFCAFIRLANYCYRSFFVEIRDSDPKDPDRIQILFFRIGLKIRKSRSLKSGIRKPNASILPSRRSRLPFDKHASPTPPAAAACCQSARRKKERKKEKLACSSYNDSPNCPNPTDPQRCQIAFL
jgi:hypothetical protein